VSFSPEVEVQQRSKAERKHSPYMLRSKHDLERNRTASDQRPKIAAAGKRKFVSANVRTQQKKSVYDKNR